VARRLQSALPQEDFLYLGDGANTPYGNHSGQEILSMTRRLLGFMRERQVKTLVVACNTISCVADQFRDEMECPVLSVLHSGAQAVARLGLDRVGVLSTCFTARSNCYPDLIRELSPQTRVVSHGCPELAEKIERYIDQPQGRQIIDLDIQKNLEGLEDLGCFLLACTHYPLAEENFRRLYPQLRWIDPAGELAESVRAYLEENDLCNRSPAQGHIEIYTTGSAREYARKAEQAGLPQVACVRHLTV